MRFIRLSLLLILSACGASESTVPKLDGVPVEAHRIFVTSETFTGNLGGASGADEKCQQVASLAGLSRTYKALISTATEDAVDRILVTEKVYVVVSDNDYMLVANSAIEFWDTDNTDLNYTVSYDENFNKVESTPWTGTTSSGQLNVNHCSNWTSQNSLDRGDVGNSMKISSFWLDSNQDSCDSNYPIYCISQ